MLEALFDKAGLAPHGICLLWRGDLFWSLAGSDAIIAASYLSISTAIAIYVIKRRDIHLRWVAAAFALFILLCATSHLSDLWTLWSPDYGIQAVIKVTTALVSLITAILLWPLIPHLLSMPSNAQLATANAALSREIEERLAVEASLNSTEKELRAANAELESFAYAVSHDLRAPLRAMTGFSTAMLEDYGAQLDETAHYYLEQVCRGGRHMGELIEGLLQLSRVTRDQLLRERVDISAMANSIRDELRQTDAGGVAAWEIEPGLSVWGDPRMIEAVLHNLLENAVKYAAKCATPIVRVTSESKNGVTFICVADNGAGFDMAHAGKLFQPFQRLHRQDEFPGIGIGLSTVSRVIQRHGGSVLADGAVGKGARFCFSVPEP